MADFKIRGSLSGFDDIEKGFNNLDDSASNANDSFTKFAKVGAVAVAAAAAAVGAAVAVGARNLLDFGDKVQKLSIATGASTESLSEMKHVAELSGSSFEALAKSWVKQQKGISEAARGVGTAKDAFEALNISVEDVIDLSVEDQFDVIADAMSGLTNETQKVEIATNLWGRAGANNLAIIQDGSKGIAEMRQQARDLGLTINNETANSIANFNDSVLSLHRGFDGLIQKALIAMLPILEDITKLFIEVTNDQESFNEGVKFLTGTLKTLVVGAVIVKNTIDALGSTFSSTAEAAVLAAKGEFSQAWDALSKGGKAVQNDFNDVRNVIDKLFNDSAESVKKSGKEMVANTRASNVSLEEAWFRHNAAVETNNKASAKELESHWAVYRKNVEVNELASLSEAWKKHDAAVLANNVASVRQQQENWKAYRDNQQINNDVILEQNRTLTRDSTATFNDMFDSFKAGIENSVGSGSWWVDRHKENMTELSDFSSSAFGKLSDSFGVAIADMVVDGEKFSMADAINAMEKQFVAMIASIALEWAVMFVLVETGSITMAASGASVSIAWGPFLLTILAITAAVIALKLVWDKWGAAGVAVAIALAVALAPVSATVVAIALGIAAVILVYKNWGKISDKLGPGFEAALKPVKIILNAIKKIIDAIISAIKKIVDLAGKAKKAVGGIGGGIVGAVGSGVGAVGGAVGWGVSGVAGGVGAIGGGIGGAIGSAGGFLGFAHGGSFLTQGPQMFMAGENGQERITVAPAGTSAVNKGGGGGMNYIFNGPVIMDSITATKFSRGQMSGINREAERFA